MHACTCLYFIGNNFVTQLWCMICIRSHFKILFNSALLRSYPFTEDWQPNLLKLETLTTNQPASQQKQSKPQVAVYFFSYLLRTVWQNRSVNPHRDTILSSLDGRTPLLYFFLIFPIWLPETKVWVYSRDLLNMPPQPTVCCWKRCSLNGWRCDWLAGWLVGGFWLGISIMLPSE